MKKVFKKFLPDHSKLHQHRQLAIFGKLLHNPNLWHLNRYSVATAFSIGLFSMFMPIPFQMVLAGAFAIIFSANLPLAVITVWISNPLTMPAMFFFAYKLGAFILQIQPQPLAIEMSWHWVTTKFLLIWQPLLLGSLICGLVAAGIGNAVIRIFWRMSVVKTWADRKKRRLLNRKKNPGELNGFK